MYSENPHEAAARELLDELSMTADEWIFLGKYRTDVNRGGGFVYSFLARRAKVVKREKHATNEIEPKEVVELTQHALTQALLRSDFGEAKWSNTVALALIRLATPNAPQLSADTPLNQE